MSVALKLLPESTDLLEQFRDRGGGVSRCLMFVLTIICIDFDSLNWLLHRESL